ncbi:MAG: sensor histidine kinase [Bacteroidota bacterium]|jgi:sensor histidine kinase YesM|nr:histidine kinase [Ignavibacteria bacterium]MCU7499437.1 histidine kinase [Ignavibacteria bacterium]MCU7512731.1 histidine kinase [Ignavibacteria bacterium]MCU7521840.1 histidine kinase [Ignavibacteria bacterium]MCU7524449.1 histidine kinase [Ignavibacteria bacterium]
MSNPLLILRNFLFYLFIWITVGVIHILFLYNSASLSLKDSISDSIVFNIVYMGLGLGLWYPVKFLSIENRSSSRFALQHVLAALSTSVLWLGLSALILLVVLNPGRELDSFLMRTAGWRILIGVMLYVIIASFYYLYIFYNSYNEKLIKESELKSYAREAELKSLKYQINPHFLFNSLNSISSLTLTDPSKAREMTIKLSEYMRMTLSESEKQFHNLSEEIKNVRLYLDIEKVRFGSKFEYVEELASSSSGVMIPPMILQPLLENAIKYGVYESLEKVIIKLSCQKENNYLKISVENNYDQEAVSPSGEKIGLKNILNRLSLVYHQDNLLVVDNRDGIFKVNIFIPLGES